MSDIYSEFGVTNAVFSGVTAEEHIESMASQPVDVRDGDDLITSEVVDTDIPAIETEGEPEVTEQEEPSDEHQADGESASDEPAEEILPITETPSTLEEVSVALDDNLSGLNDMVETAIKNGMSQETYDTIVSEYEAGEGLSDASYEALAAAGYTKGFVQSYLRGQEALATQYGNGIVEMCGGRAQFDSMVEHLKATDAGSLSALNEAIESRQINTVKAIVNLANKSRVKTFGAPAARSVSDASNAKPAAVRKAVSDGFTSKSQMVKAMSDPRYNRDQAYTQDVRNKVANATW